MNKWFVILFLLLISNSSAQENQETKKVPGFKLFRAEEIYDYLKDSIQNKRDFINAIKFIPFNNQRTIYATIGGQIRLRYEHFSNRNWIKDANEDYYSHRLALHTNVVLGKYVRVFGELYNGYTSFEKKIVQYDELTLHQAFAEVNLPIKQNHTISFRFGRQEMGLGTTRLVGIREGPNIRRAFDGVRLIYNSKNVTVNSFYTKEVFSNFYVFDNKFTLFDDDAPNPKLYGIYSQFKINGLQGFNELYYLGFETNFSKFNDLSGKEKRHTIGLRRFGKVNSRLSFNTEIMYQFGKLGDANISTFNIGTDTHYLLNENKWKPNIGLKLNWSSGDKSLGDNKANTFNPMYVNPSFYSLSSIITPVNIFSAHPSISIKPIPKWTVFMDWSIFWRASKNDGLYTPPRFLIRESDGINERYIGNIIGLKSFYTINRHLIIDLNMSYFITGSFIEKSGDSENVFHISPTISYKF